MDMAFDYDAIGTNDQQAPQGSLAQPREKLKDLISSKLLAQHRLARRIGSVSLENILRQVEPDSDNLRHDRPPLWIIADPPWHIDAVGGRSHHQSQLTHYLPDFAKSAWDGATVRQVIDMTVGVRYGENYDDKRADVWQHTSVFGWRPRRETTPGSIREYARSLTEKDLGHGQVFTYRAICTDVLGMIIEVAMQRPLVELAQDEIWAKLRTRHDAVIINDPTGFSFADGGLSVCARDLARFGVMLLNDGKLHGEQIVPASWIRDTLDADERAKQCFETSYYNEIMPGWQNRNQCWIPASWGRDALLGLGIHGQTLLVDQTNRVVIAKFSSQPEHDNEAMYMATIAMVNAISTELRGMTKNG